MFKKAFIILFAFFLQFNSSEFAKAEAKICAISNSFSQMFSGMERSRNSRYPFELAFNHFKKPHVATYVYNSAATDLDLINKLKTAVHDGCKVILGFYISRECLLVGPILKENKVVGFSPGCAHNRINEYFPYLMTAVPSLESYLKTVSDYLNGREEKIFVFYQPSDVFSRISYAELRKNVNKEIVEIKIDRSGRALEENFPEISTTKNLYVFLTYPLTSLGMLGSLDAKKLVGKGSIIVGSSSWAFDQELLAKNKNLLKKADSVMLPGFYSEKKARAKLPNGKTINETLQDPSPPMVALLAYDAAVASLMCGSEVKDDFQASKFVSCLRRLNYNGLTGVMKYSENSSFAVRDIEMLPLDVSHLK